MRLADLRARLRHFDQMALDLMCQRDAWRACYLPQLPEHRAYDRALTEAIAGLEQARITLAGIVRRLEDGAGRRQKAH